MRERESSSSLRIRKLTAKECMRLMGFTDDDYEAMKQANLSDMVIFHSAGDSIVSTCLIAIISSMVIPNKDCHISIIQNYIDKDLLKKIE